MKVSVLICTHNPRQDYLDAVLKSLESQSLPKKYWELLLIDNNSRIPVKDKFDVSWHPNACHNTEKRLGLTFARLNGFSNANGDIIVLVDDDNILSSDYLERCLEISNKHPNIGAWAGNVLPKYESRIPCWFGLEEEEYLACCRLTVDIWSNDPLHWKAIPFGAGLVIRSAVAKYHLQLLEREPIRALLDRVGEKSLGGGDVDIARSAIRLGMGLGRFKALSLVHLIPSNRVSAEYLTNLVRGSSASCAVLEFLDGRGTLSSKVSKKELLWLIANIFRVPFVKWRIQLAILQGRKMAECVYFQLLKKI